MLGEGVAPDSRAHRLFDFWNCSPKIEPATVSRHRLECDAVHWEDLLRLRLFVQFHSISRMKVFHSENDHSRRCGGCGPDYHNFAYGAPWQIADVNHRTVALGEHVRVDGSLLLLCIFAKSGLEGERIYRILEICFVIPYRAEIVPEFHSLVGSDVHVNFLTGSKLRVKISGHHDSPRYLTARRQVPVEAQGRME